MNHLFESTPQNEAHAGLHIRVPQDPDRAGILGDRRPRRSTFAPPLNSCSRVEDLGEDEQHCCVDSVIVDFAALGWHFLLSPPTLEFTYCRCLSVHLKSNSQILPAIHSLILDPFQQTSKIFKTSQVSRVLFGGGKRGRLQKTPVTKSVLSKKVNGMDKSVSVQPQNNHPTLQGHITNNHLSLQGHMCSSHSSAKSFHLCSGSTSLCEYILNSSMWVHFTFNSSLFESI